MIRLIDNTYIEISGEDFTFEDIKVFWEKTQNAKVKIEGWILKDERSQNKLRQLRDTQTIYINEKIRIANTIYGIQIYGKICV